MSKIEVNQISSQCGSTLTIGQSGDTVTLAAGATQSGFGRTGTVDWDTTAKTTSFTAVSGNGYFVNTTSGAITVTLPASPSAGDIVAIADYARTFTTNNVTINRNGSLIQGDASNGVISVNGRSTTFVYVDGTKGWIPTEDQTTGTYGALYVSATGGTISYCGNYKIHTFTGPGTFCVSCAGSVDGSQTVDYLVVAGGGAGSGGGPAATTNGGGGGGAGGYRESSGAASGCYTRSPLGACVSALPVSVQGYPIVVGGGGSAGTASNPSVGGSGSNSSFSSITSAGGGGGGCGSNDSPTNPNPGVPGGSGGGAGWYPGSPTRPGGTGNTPPVSPPQGNNGGNSTTGNGGGGAGATAGGTNSGCQLGGGPGGAGATSAINGTPTARAGGGGGGRWGPGIASTGGTGGGGNGGSEENGYPATVNTGGGGGGAGAFPPGVEIGGAGGSGIVIISYRYQ